MRFFLIRVHVVVVVTVVVVSSSVSGLHGAIRRHLELTTVSHIRINDSDGLIVERWCV